MLAGHSEGSLRDQIPSTFCGLTMLGPHVPSFGPSPNRVFILGEAPGKEETDQLRPFVGPSGRELRRMLRTVGFNMDEAYRSNVFDRRPNDANDLATSDYAVPREHPAACLDFGPLTSKPVTFLNAQYAPRIEALYSDILTVSPNVIIALGGTATWALGLSGGISALRGSVHAFEYGGKQTKIVPTFHPAAVLREWPLRVTAIADLEKALRESSVPDFKFDNAQLWLRPTLDDLEEFGDRYMENATITATDVETRKGQISCVSFAPDVGHALVVPFWVDDGGPHYWPNVPSEVRAWRWVQRWVEKASLVKVTQNGVYDMMYFRNPHGMTPRGFSEDTMLAHHSLFSELRKGLGYLGSIYANVPSWKEFRTYKKEEQLKRED